MGKRALAGFVLLVGCAANPPYIAARTGESPARVPEDVDHAEGTFDARDKTKLFEQSWRPRGDAKGVLVVVHGLKDHSGRYADFAEYALRRGFAVHAFDLRGHGRSEGARVYVDSFDDYLADLDVFLERVRAKEHASPVLFGHSMGGAIVTLYGLTHKAELKGAILSGAALEADVSGATVFGTKVVAALSPHAAVFQLELDDFSRDPASVWWTRVDPLVYQEPGPARTAKEVLGAIDRIQEHMEDVRGPILIMHGGADKVTPPHGSRELFRRSRAPDKTLRIYDGLYHDLLHEPERDQVTRDILEWLEHHV
jgi:alpha-beta hydrolase superfamily lysophospholipase